MEKALSGMREGSLFDDAESAATDKASDGKISNTYPTIGVDESGKGDTFGPLVAAAVLIPDQETADALKKGGVRDSKLIGSAKEIDRIAAMIFSRCGQERISIVAVNPPRYNELIREMAARKEGVNQLLGWAQARSIRELLERNLGCRKVICDQFGKREDVTRPLGALAKDLDLETTPKGERFLAVAAASIVARSRFTFLLKKLAADQNMAELPLGSSNPSIGPLIETILRDKGPTGLSQVAKVHFKNVQRYL